MSVVALSTQLRRAADAVWQAQREHPFVRGIADGTLTLERFSFYVRQDYVFRIEYARLLALAGARSPDLATMTRFSQLTTEILTTEMDLHRSFAAELGISAAEPEAESPAPTTQGYTDFLVRTAAQGDFAELAAALLPCMWGYAEIGQALAREGRSPDERYARWVATYASAEFAELTNWCPALSIAWTPHWLTTGGHGWNGPFSRPAATSSRFGRWPGTASAGRSEPRFLRGPPGTSTGCGLLAWRVVEAQSLPHRRLEDGRKVMGGVGHEPCRRWRSAGTRLARRSARRRHRWR